eukprot:Em0009g589a
MSGLDVKVILLFTLLGTALASRTLSKAEANSLTDYAEMQDEDLELTLQQDKAQLMLTYAKIAEEHAELIQFRHEVMKMGLFCTPCKKVVGYLLDLAMSDKIKDIVKGELDTKCSSLSFVLKTGCSFVVDHFFDTLWKSIRDHRDTVGPNLYATADSQPLRPFSIIFNSYNMPCCKCNGSNARSFTAAARNASSSFTAAGHNPYVSSTAFTTRIVAAIPAEPFFPTSSTGTTVIHISSTGAAFSRVPPTSSYPVQLRGFITFYITPGFSFLHLTPGSPSGPSSSPHQASSAGPSSSSTSHQATSSGPSSSLQASSSGLSTIRKQCIVESCPAHIAPSMWHNHMTLHAKGALPGIVPSKWLSEHNLFDCPSCSQLVSNSSLFPSPVQIIAKIQGRI